jgi:hypothetical protein
MHNCQWRRTRTRAARFLVRRPPRGSSGSRRSRWAVSSPSFRSEGGLSVVSALLTLRTFFSSPDLGRRDTFELRLGADTHTARLVDGDRNRPPYVLGSAGQRPSSEGLDRLGAAAPDRRHRSGDPPFRRGLHPAAGLTIVAGHVRIAEFGVHLPGCLGEDGAGLEEGLEIGENGGPANGGCLEIVLARNPGVRDS